MGMSFGKPLKERIQMSANITLERKKHENNNKKERKNIIPFMAIEPTDQNAYDCESSVLTTMLERMLLFTASYDKYILSRSITQKVQHSVQ